MAVVRNDKPLNIYLIKEGYHWFKKVNGIWRKVSIHLLLTGPVIVHKSEMPFPLELNISSKINGETRQDSNTRHMIKDVAQIISELSKGI